MKDAAVREVGGVRVEIVKTGSGRMKRAVYPAGFRWSTHMKPVVGTDLCMHAHVGFLARGRMKVQFGDGCTREFTAPQMIAIEPGHDGWVIGDESAVLIECDFEGDTVQKFGLPSVHTHESGTKSAAS